MRKFELISLTFAVILIMIITIFSYNKTVRRFTAVSKGRFLTMTGEKVTKLCKKLRQKERIRWNYFYYYQNHKNDKSLLWCKVPKAGSTTLTKLFLYLAGATEILEKNDTKVHKTLRSYYPRPIIKNSTKYLSASYKFIIVRHPFERILSAYRDKLENYQRDLRFRDGYYYNKYGRFMKLSNSTRKEPTWQEFVSYLLRTPVSRFDEHWMPMTRLCSPCKVKYDAIIKLQTFSTEIKKIFKKIGVPVSNSVVGYTHRTGSSNLNVIRKYFQKLSLKDVKQLYKKYKHDFMLFGYTPTNYYNMAKK